MKNNNYKYLLFDIDDTLIDNVENVKFAFKQILKVLKLPYSDEEYEKWRSFESRFWREWEKLITPKEFFEPLNRRICWIRSQRFLKYFDGLTLKYAKMLNDIYISALEEIVCPISGAYETLSELDRMKKSSNSICQIYAATNGPSDALKAKLSKINCNHFFSGCFSADKFGAMKPNVAFFDGIKKELNDFDNSRYLLIGDSLISDIQGAMNAGIDSCWLNVTQQKNETDWIPTYEISKLQELIKIIKKQNSLYL